MAAEADGRYSRAPELEDVVELCRQLNDAAGVRYLLIGGFAVILHGFVRGTKDIDLLVDASADNVARLRRALAYLPTTRPPRSRTRMLLAARWCEVAEEIVVDLMARACGVDYTEAVGRGGREWFNLEGVEVALATKELLVRLKDTVRPADAMDVEYLRTRLAEEQ